MAKDLTATQQRVARLLADFFRREQPAFVTDLVKTLGLAGESSLTPTLLKMERNGFIEVQRAGLQGRSRLVKLTAKGRHATGIGGLPLLGHISAGLLSEGIPQGERLVEVDELLSHQPGDFLLRVNGDSMIGDGILDGDYVLIRPQTEITSGTIAAICVGDDREATLKRVFLEGEKIRLRAANPIFQDIVVPAQQVWVAGVLKRVVRHVGSHF